MARKIPSKKIYYVVKIEPTNSEWAKIMNNCKFCNIKEDIQYEAESAIAILTSILLQNITRL